MDSSLLFKFILYFLYIQFGLGLFILGLTIPAGYVTSRDGVVVVGKYIGAVFTIIQVDTAIAVDDL